MGGFKNSDIIPKTSLGVALKDIRRTYAISQKDLARRAKLSQVTVSSLETGKRGPGVATKTLHSLAVALVEMGVSKEYLVTLMPYESEADKKLTDSFLKTLGVEKTPQPEEPPAPPPQETPPQVDKEERIVRLVLSLIKEVKEYLG